MQCMKACLSVFAIVVLTVASVGPFGQVAAFAADDKDEIVGRWDIVRSGKKGPKEVAGYMRFKADGTFTSTLAFLATDDGKYKFVSSKVIELDFPGVIFGRNKVELKFKIDGDVFTLEEPQRSIDLEFKRVDSGK